MSNFNLKCLDKTCNGDLVIKYDAKKINYDDVNFNCTTDTYKKPKIYVCKKCEILFSELVFNFQNNQFEKSYKDVKDEKYISQIEYKKIYFEDLSKKIYKELNTSNSVLEIGSYYGLLGSIINEKVKNYYGLELSYHGCKFSKDKFNLNIFNETIEEHSKRKIKYDLIIMADVIEHFADPFSTFEIVNKLLNKNGKLILTTFNMDSLYAKITGKNYHWIIPYHLAYFSNKTLKDIGKKNNLELYKIENDTRTVSVGYLLEKLIFIFPRLSLIFKFLFKFKLLRKLSIKINLRDLNIYYYIKSN